MKMQEKNCMNKPLEVKGKPGVNPVQTGVHFQQAHWEYTALPRMI